MTASAGVTIGSGLGTGSAFSGTGGRADDTTGGVAVGVGIDATLFMLVARPSILLNLLVAGGGVDADTGVCGVGEGSGTGIGEVG